MCQLLVTANVVSSSLIIIILIVEETCSTETSILTRAVQRHILEDGILHSHYRENLKYYNVKSSSPWQLKGLLVG
jgi:hypothetical protein